MSNNVKNLIAIVVGVILTALVVIFLPRLLDDEASKAPGGPATRLSEVSPLGGVPVPHDFFGVREQPAEDGPLFVCWVHGNTQCS